MKETGIPMMDLVLVMHSVIWVKVEILGVRRVRSVMIVRQIVRMKHGFVLMVVDHHPTHDTVDSGPDRLTRACARLLPRGHHHTAGRGRRGVKDVRRGVKDARRGVKDTRRGRELWDRREGASEETRGRGGAVLGDLRFLEFLRLVWIKS